MADDDKKPAAPRPVVQPHATPHAPPTQGGGVSHQGQIPAGGPSFAGQADDKAASANAERLQQAQAQNAPVQLSDEQKATPAPGLEGTRQMWIIVGPYKGSVLTMPDAEAENAKDNHWAVEMADMLPPFDANEPLEHDHELTDEDRENAVREANEWAAKVNQPPEPPPPEGGEGGATRGGKALHPDRPGGDRPGGEYVTKAPPKK